MITLCIRKGATCVRGCERWLPEVLTKKQRAVVLWGQQNDVTAPTNTIIDIVPPQPREEPDIVVEMGLVAILSRNMSTAPAIS